MNKNSFFLLAIVLVLSCSTPSRWSSLVDKGLLTLSPDNAYLGSNLFLGQEIEKSNYLFNFFQSKGAPVAISLTGESEKALEVRFYYPREHSFYIGKRDLGKSKEWVVRGPYGIPRRDMMTLIRMQANNNNEAVFDVWGRLHKFRAGVDGRDGYSEEVLIPVFVPTPTPTPTPRPVKKKVIKVVGPTPTP